MRLVAGKVGTTEWNHQALILLDTLCKDIGGATRINCKSGKDRTQLLTSILKAVAIHRAISGQSDVIMSTCYRDARALMWGSGLQVAIHNTGLAAFKLAPHILAQSLFSEHCVMFAYGILVGIAQYCAAAGALR